MDGSTSTSRQQTSDLTVGARGVREASHSELITFKDSPEITFAYQLRGIRVRQRGYSKSFNYDWESIVSAGGRYLFTLG
jgi:hypothetical protein